MYRICRCQVICGGKKLPPESFYFTNYNQDKLSAYCKQCTYYVTQVYKSRIQFREINSFVCVDCEERKPHTKKFFNKCKRSISGLSIRCKECKKKKDEINAESRRRYQREKGREERRKKATEPGHLTYCNHPDFACCCGAVDV